MSLDSKLAETYLKAAMPEKSIACITTFTKKLVTRYQFLRISRNGWNIRNISYFKIAISGLFVFTWSADFESKLKPFSGYTVKPRIWQESFQKTGFTKWELVLSYNSFLNGSSIPCKIIFSIPLKWQSLLGLIWWIHKLQCVLMGPKIIMLCCI